MSFLPVARKTDMAVGYCVVHGGQTGRIITGKPTTIVNTLIDSTIGDTVLANCGHTGRIITGNYTDIDNMFPVARVTDKFVGVFSGIIVKGSQNTIS